MQCAFIKGKTSQDEDPYPKLNVTLPPLITFYESAGQLFDST